MLALGYSLFNTLPVANNLLGLKYNYHPGINKIRMQNIAGIEWMAIWNPLCDVPELSQAAGQAGGQHLPAGRTCPVTLTRAQFLRGE